MKIAIISGSHRKNSQSQKVGKFIENDLVALNQGITTETFILGDLEIPLWDEEVWAGTDRWKGIFGPISAKLSEADAFVIISPEWAGMVPPALKNFFLLCSKSELSHKPGLIVGVSAGRSGSYPVAELRMSSYKNTQICYLPEHIIVRDVTKVLNDATPAPGSEDLAIRERITFANRLLVSYAKALKIVRSELQSEFKKFPYGM